MRATAKLLLNIILGLVVLLIGSAMCFFSYKQYIRMQHDLDDKNRQVLDSRRKLVSIREDQRQINDKLERYNQYLQRGVIGPEQRLVWVEVLRRLRKAQNMNSAPYQFKPREALNLPGVSPTAGSRRFMASAMTLSLSLAHEEDLLRYFDNLREQAPALIHQQSCDIERKVSAGANLQAKCELLWITLDTAS